MNIWYYSSRNRFYRDDWTKCYHYLFSCLGNVVVGSMTTVAKCFAMPLEDIENHPTIELTSRVGMSQVARSILYVAFLQENLDIKLA